MKTFIWINDHAGDVDEVSDLSMGSNNSIKGKLTSSFSKA